MSKRLLLVEDEEHLAFTLEFNLTQEGYQVDTAMTLADAERRLEESYDLIVLDVMLPDGDGVQFCRGMRARGNHTPVLFLTAKGAPDDVVAGLEAGGDDYITKPFVLKELLARIVAMLRRSSWTQESNKESLPERFTFGKASVDFHTHEVTVEGEKVELTALEFRLLSFFISNVGQVLSREALLEEVWEVSAKHTTRTVDNFLVRLRRLFEQNPSKPKHFVTVRGVGYRFIAEP